MIQTEIIQDFSNTQRLANSYQTFDARFARNVRADFNQHIRLGILAQLRRTPASVHYPIQWQSDKQRAAFFATDGFGHGIPYKRTGKMVAAWRTDITVNDAVIVFSVSNTDPKEKYVTGKRQQRMHAASGWILHANVFNAWKPRVREVVFNAAKRTTASAS